MDKRKELLLKLIVESYIKTAEPVGSNFLVLKSGLDISAPTIRNEMRELEELGFLTHPHTSAGRIPTELGYQYYVENLMEEDKIKQKTRTRIEDLVKDEKDEIKKVKSFAKLISEVTGEAVIVAFNPDNIYYTGISSLFSQPEFRDNQSITSISNIFDNCEDGMGEMFETIGQEIDILIGQKNPFGKACGLVATKFGGQGLLVIIGPTRMDYGESVGLLKIVKLLNG
ncbi:MAG TPA: hypothetical protein DEB09_04205 [Candidatus Magasanikbacteria bacterium]|nr:hypothetical protein [Candidatus Magasanikbacteria bacterium]